MKLVCLGELIVNLSFLVDAEWVTRQSRDSGESVRNLQLRFACPSPTGIGASDWTTGPTVVVLPQGPTADVVWSLLFHRCEPPRVIGDIIGRTVSR